MYSLSGISEPKPILANVPTASHVMYEDEINVFLELYCFLKPLHPQIKFLFSLSPKRSGFLPYVHLTSQQSEAYTEPKKASARVKVEPLTLSLVTARKYCEM